MCSKKSFNSKYGEIVLGNKWAETVVAVVDSVASGDTIGGASMVGSLSSEIAESAQTAATFGFYGGVETTKTEDKTTVVNGMDVGVGAIFVSNGGMNFESANGDIDLRVILIELN